MPEDRVLTLSDVQAAPEGSTRTALASDLYRQEIASAATGRTRRDLALCHLVRVDGMRPAQVERLTGITPSMTNYATNRSLPDELVEQPVETIRAAVAEIDQAEATAEEARKIRDQGIRDLLASGTWAARDLPALVGLTASRISQITGGLAAVTPARTTDRPLRFAPLPDIAAELSRRAELHSARDPEGSHVLAAAADAVGTVHDPEGPS